MSVLLHVCAVHPFVFTLPCHPSVCRLRPLEARENGSMGKRYCLLWIRRDTGLFIVSHTVRSGEIVPFLLYVTLKILTGSNLLHNTLDPPGFSNGKQLIIMPYIKVTMRLNVTVRRNVEQGAIMLHVVSY